MVSHKTTLGVADGDKWCREKRHLVSRPNDKWCRFRLTHPTGSLGSIRDKSPMRVIPAKPNSNFTQVPNEILFADDLTTQDKLTWAQLQSLCLNDDLVAGSVTQLAARIGMEPRNLQRQVQNLVKKGAVTRDGHKYRLETQVNKRHMSGKQDKLPQWLSEEQLCEECLEIWNKRKPINAPSLHKFKLEFLNTLRVYAKHFDCDEKTVLRKVLKGSNADAFRRDKNWGFVNIFGSGIPTQQKQQVVEKVYKLGCSAKGQAAGFDVEDDDCWLDWYASVDHDMKRVVRINEDDRVKAWEHQVENQGDQVIYIYIHSEGYLTHWTYKDNQVGVSYLPSAS